MSFDVRMDYAMVEEMARVFLNARQQLLEAEREMLQIASSLEAGTLTGVTGDRLTDALRTELKNSLQILQEKMLELNDDLHRAIAYNRDGIADAKSRFS